MHVWMVGDDLALEKCEAFWQMDSCGEEAGEAELNLELFMHKIEA